MGHSWDRMLSNHVGLIQKMQPRKIRCTVGAAKKAVASRKRSDDTAGRARPIERHPHTCSACCTVAPAVHLTYFAILSHLRPSWCIKPHLGASDSTNVAIKGFEIKEFSICLMAAFDCALPPANQQIAATQNRASSTTSQHWNLTWCQDLDLCIISTQRMC